MPILSNLSRDIQCSTVLFNITRVTISAYSYQSCDIGRNIQISSEIVRYVPILSSIDQYCPVAPCVDIFPLEVNHKTDLDTVKLWKLVINFLTKQAFFHFENQASNPKTSFTQVFQLNVLFEIVFWSQNSYFVTFRTKH